MSLCPVFLFRGLHFRQPGCHRQPRAGEGSRAAFSVVKLKKSWSRIQLFPFLCQTFCFPGFKMSSLWPKSCHRSRFRVTSWKLIPGFMLANNVFFFWNWLMRTWRGRDDSGRIWSCNKGYSFKFSHQIQIAKLRIRTVDTGTISINPNL